MNILLSIHHHLDPDSGAAGCTLKLGNQYQNMGHQVQFFSFDNMPSLFGEKLSEILFPIFLAVKIFLLVRKKSVDVVDVSTGDGWVWEIIGPMLFRSRPIVITRSHGLEHLVDRMYKTESAKGNIELSWKYKLYHGFIKLRLVQLSMRKADAVFMLNKQEFEFAINNLRIDRERAFVISHGIDRSFLNASAKPAGKEKSAVLRIALIGSFIPRKGIHYSIPALSRILKKYSSVEVLFLGTGCSQDDVYERFENHLHNRIRVVPHYSHKDLPSLLKDYHIVLFPSLSEGFGLTLLEAMACGLAPVASSVEGPLEFIEDGKNGLLIIPCDSRQIKNALKKLITDRELLGKLRTNAHSTAQQYTWESSAAQQIALYRKMVIRT